MLHLTKLAVGVRDLEHLRALQAERALVDPPLRHRTRHFPRLAAEVTAGGSIFWVIGGVLAARQRVLEIRRDSWDDDSGCAGLLLDPVLVPIHARPVKPFQCWRYLQPAAEPGDLSAAAPEAGPGGLPPRLRRELRDLC